MLKIVKASFIILITTVGFSMPAKANQAVAEALANICTIVKVDDSSELRKKMRSVQSNHKLKLRDYYQGISCQGNSLIRTAILNNSVETGTLMLKKMPGKELIKPEKDGKTLSAWIQENDLSANPLATVLKERL